MYSRVESRRHTRGLDDVVMHFYVRQETARLRLILAAEKPCLLVRRLSAPYWPAVTFQQTQTKKGNAMKDFYATTPSVTGAL